MKTLFAALLSCRVGHCRYWGISLTLLVRWKSPVTNLADLRCTMVPYYLVVYAWFNDRTVQLRTLPLVPSPTGPHPARGDSGVCMCIHVCLLWSVFPTAFRVPHHLPVCWQLHTDSPAQLDSIWTCRNAHMRSEGSSPTGDRTRVARLAVQCSTDWATPSSSGIDTIFNL